MSRPENSIDVRTLICDHFAALLNSGARQVRVRVSQPQQQPAEVWFYSHQNNEWHKSADLVRDAALAVAIDDLMERIASKPHGDEWSARRHKASDFVDTDVTFHGDKIAAHSGAGLSSFVHGLLFRDDHDSRQDRRQSLRHGPAGK
ncbi:MAG: hypothetical protein EHM42_04830 [Planctomycetaceae bacterium]|nr:MAG: hypothetical protein EHM42_04830 [Planctomycetaceae bacterium]